MSNFSNENTNILNEVPKGENEIHSIKAAAVPVGMRTDKEIKKQHKRDLKEAEALAKADIKEIQDKDFSKKEISEEKDLSADKKMTEKKPSEKMIKKDDLSSDKKEEITEEKEFAPIQDKELIMRDISAAQDKAIEKKAESSEIKKDGEEIHSETMIEKAKDIAIDAKDAIVEGAHVVTDAIKGAVEKTLEFFKSN